ncbi:hypothetical protein [Treponema endosymbiont of Eucomonympha sp.]|uniref:hypothetical protein n=1 Tax=Treponema endosymbiont of Eucomonympha sp. TaxID=1580831 RepID=UPI0007847ED7|nr:hypothetical protein [Treponema endosymbiont of Eucomonympha sp.]
MDYNQLVSFITMVTTCSGVIEVLILLAFGLVNAFFKKQLDHVYEQSIETFKMDLTREYTKDIESIKAEISAGKEESLKEIQKYLDVAFRNEAAVSIITANMVINADKVRIELYQKIYGLFLKIMYSHDTILKEADKTKQKEMIQALHNEINNIRTDIFANSIYLGGLIDCLLPAQIGLWNDLGVLESKIAGTWRGQTPEDFKSSNEIRNAEKWISENMKPYLTINNIDLPKEMIDELNKKRTEIIKENLAKN